MPYRDHDIDSDIYIEKIKDYAFFAGDFEISQSIYIFEINIAVYKAKDNVNNYKFLRYYENINSGKEKLPLIILSYDETRLHYQLLTFIKKQFPDNNNRNKNIENIHTYSNFLVKTETINVTYIHNNKINNQIEKKNLIFLN